MNIKFAAVGLFVILVVVGCYWYYSKPYHVVPAEMTVQQKKERFKQLVLPVIVEVYKELDDQYRAVKKQLDTGSGGFNISEVKQKYKVETDKQLLMALKPSPISLALAQAAMESSWATSRFFNEANNIFGVWSFDEDEPRIAANKKRGNKTVWLKKYPTLQASIEDYYLTLARSGAFAEFRQLKMVTDDPFALAGKLDRYSEKGTAYGEELAGVIRHNDFEQYDKVE